MSPLYALIIDDNENNINVLAQLLQIESVEVLSLSSLNNLDNHLAQMTHVKAIFLDLEFPRSNGYEALGTIKSMPQFSDIPVIAYTVHVNEFERISQMGFDGFLGKPVSAEDFPEQWQKILKGQKIWYIP